MLEDTYNMKINEYLPLRDIVFQTLRNAIIIGELQPGERLMETQLAEKLGVSRTPIREAIRKLELEGLVIMVPRKGAQVAQFTEKDIQDVLEVRAALESLAAKLACKRMDDRSFLKLQLAIAEYSYAAKNKDLEMMIEKDVEFHDIICNATQNDKLIQLFNNLKEQVNRYRITYLKNVEDSETVEAEHLAILEALKNKDEDVASLLASKHIHTQCDTITDFVKGKCQ
ncbi:MAG: GntR family transcriptional regulator [Cellulosilyticum sp.]|nr:GntR family transcriptional regulator [Cellulosilyticum sp.]